LRIKELRVAAEAEVVAEFLGAEIDSNRWDQAIISRMPGLGLTPRQIRQPDLTDETANRQRASLLGQYRGWRGNDYLFRGFPSEVEWALVRLDRTDFVKVRYANSPEWQELSRQTWDPQKGANRVKGGDSTIPAVIPVANIKAIATGLRDGRTFPPLIAVQARASDLIVLIEGHSRFTACCMVTKCESVDVLLGTTDLVALRRWDWLPPLFDQ